MDQRSLQVISVYAAAISALAIGGCASQSRIGQSAEQTAALPDARQIEGTWTMDVSPAQDGSALHDFVVTPRPPKAGKADTTPTTFTGLVYDNNEFSNGLCHRRGDLLVFSFASDVGGQYGGPYYFLGVDDGSGTLRGRVRAIARDFELEWSAVKKK